MGFLGYGRQWSLVSGWTTLILDAVLQPGVERVKQVVDGSRVVTIESPCPLRCRFPYLLADAFEAKGTQLPKVLLHHCPHIFNWVEIWGVRRPVLEHIDFLLLQPSLHTCNAVDATVVLHKLYILTANFLRQRRPFQTLQIIVPIDPTFGTVFEGVAST